MVRWAHEIADLPSPTSSAFVKSTWDGCKRLLASRPVRPKDPLEVGVLCKLAADFKKPTLPDLRLLVLCLLCYSGILRIDEVLKIHVSNIVFSESSMRLRIPKRKNDQYRDGHQLNIAKTGTSVCPVTATRRFAKLDSTPILISSAGWSIAKAVTQPTIQECLIPEPDTSSETAFDSTSVRNSILGLAAFELVGRHMLPILQPSQTWRWTNTQAGSRASPSIPIHQRLGRNFINCIS